MVQTKSKFSIAKSLMNAYANQGIKPAVIILNTYEQLKNRSGELLAARYIINVHDKFHIELNKTANVG